MSGGNESWIGLDHVQVAIPPGSEEQARRFYVETLGLREIPKPAALAGRGGLWLTAGANELHLGVERDFRPARKAHPAFLTRAIDALAQRLSQGGCLVTFDEALPDRRRFFVHDPFGNRLEIIEAGRPSRPSRSAP